MKLRPKQLDLSKDMNFTGGNINLANGQLLVGNGTEQLPSISFSSDHSTGLFLASHGEIGLSAGSHAYVYLKEDGTVEMTGTTGLAIQAGTTADRPSAPLDGLMRYNLDTSLHESYLHSSWQPFVFDNDNRFTKYHTLTVSKTPTKGQFTTIASALAAISGASTTNRYIINVGPGTFVEPTLVVPQWVGINGEAFKTIVQAAAANQHLFNPDVNTTITNITPTGVTGANYAAFYCHSTSTQITGSVVLNNIRFGANNTQVYVQQDAGTYCTAYVDGGLIGADGSFDQGFIAVGPGSARINVRALTTNGTTNPSPTTMFRADGPLCTVLSAGSLYRSSTATGTGVHLRNGGTARFVGVSFVGFAKAMWTENVGAAPTLNADGINLQSNTQDIFIEHPGTVGHFLGCAERAKVNVNTSSLITIFYSDPVGTGITSVGPLYLGATHSTTVEMGDLLTRSTTMGVMQGGTLTSGGGLVINISAGFGYASTDTATTHTITKPVWPTSSLTLPPNQTNYIYVTAGTVLSYSPTMPSLVSNILLGRVVTNSTMIAWIEATPSNSNHASNALELMLRDSFGPVYAKGSLVTENITTARTLDIGGGEYYYGTVQFNPVGGSSVSMRQFYHTGGAWTYTDKALIDNTQYDNLTGLTALTANYYVRHSIYVTGAGANERYLMVYGQTQYASLVQVESAPLPLPPSSISDSVVLIASVIIKQGQSNIVEIFDHRSKLGFATPSLSAATTHGNLLGLGADDHKQYLLANGGRAMNGSLDMGTNNVINGGTFNGVTVETHGSRHLPNGADPLTSAAAVGLSLSTSNAAGIANSFARSDHTHTITGVQPSSAELTAHAGLSTTGLITRTAAGAITTRTINGTSSVVVTNGDGVAGPPVVTIADNVVLPGTAGFVPSTGTTAQRLASPTTGTIRYNTDLARVESYFGGTWNSLASTSDLSGLLRIDGTLAMTGNLNMGGKNITSVGSVAATSIVSSGTVSGTTHTGTTFNGVVVETHASRHLPNGADPLATDVASALTLSTTNGAGTANSFARSDHTHTITGVQPSSSELTAYAGLASTGLVTRTAAGAITARTITGTANTISVVNGNGIAGNPVLTIADNAVLPGTASLTLPTGTTAQRPGTASSGMLRYDSTLAKIQFYQTAAWHTIPDTIVSSITAGTGLTGGTITDTGTIGLEVAGIPTVTGAQYKLVAVDQYGRVTSGLLDSTTYTSILMESPATTGNWPVQNTATAGLDPTYTTLTVRSFDDSRSEGVSIQTMVPPGSVNMRVSIIGRSRTPPTTAKAAIWQAYARVYPAGTTPAAWSGAVNLQTIAIPANATYFSQTDTIFPISTIGLTSGNAFQIEIVRVGANAGDTLVGDYMVLSIKLEWL